MPKDVKFNIKIVIDGKEHVVSASMSAKELAQNLSSAKTASEKFRDSLLRWNYSLQSLQNITSALGELTKANGVQIEAETKLANNMRNTMDATDGEVEAIKRLCAAQQELGVIGDEVQLAGAQELATYLEKKSSLEKLIPVMNDMLAQQYGLNATSEAAASIATMLGKVMEGQVNALSRYGYKFDEAQEMVLKFGEEEERAAVLAEVVESSVGGMNAELAKTDAGKAKQAANAFGDWKEQLGAMIAPYEKILVYASQMGILATSMAPLVSVAWKGAKGLWALTNATRINAFNQRMASGIVGVFTGKLVAETAATRAATIATKLLTWAIRALEVASVVGAIIAAISFAVECFGDSAVDAADDADEFADKVNEAAEAAKRSQQAYESASSSTFSDLMTKFDKLKQEWGNLGKAQKTGWIKNHKKEFAELGLQIDSVGAAEKAFKGNTEAVVKAFTLRAKAAGIAAQMAEDYRLQMELTEKISAADAAAKARHEIKEGDPFVGPYQKSMSDKGLVRERKGYDGVVFGWEYTKKGAEEANKGKNWVASDASTGYARTALMGVDARLKRSEVKMAKLQQEMQSNGFVGGGDDGNNTTNKSDVKKLIANPKQKSDYENNVAYYNQQLDKVNINDKEAVKALLDKKKAMEEVLKTFKESQEDYSTPTETLAGYELQIRRLQEIRKTAAKEEVIKIDGQIKALENKRQELEDASIANLKDDEITAYEEIDAKVRYYERQLASADKTQRTTINAQIERLKKLRANMEATDAAALLHANPTTLSEIEDNIGIYKEQQQHADAENLGKLQEKINELTKKRGKIEFVIELQNMKEAAAAVEKLTGARRKKAIGDLGYDELESRIEGLQEKLAEGGLAEGQRKEIEGLIGTYREWQREALKSVDTVKAAWGGVKGIGSGIEGITSALEGNKDAWSALTGMVDGFLQMYEGIMAVVEIIKKITEATKGATAAKAVENAVTEAGTAATTADTAATIGNTVATEAEATADAKDAGAKVTKEGAKLPFPANIAAIAAGIAAVVAALAMVSGFATGGIVGGTSYSGDKVMARVNSGEMILNKRQQARLFGLLDGRLGGRFRTGVAPTPVALNVDGLRSAIGTGTKRVEFRVKGRNLVGAMANETRITSKSGKRSNIVIS